MSDDQNNRPEQISGDDNDKLVKVTGSIKDEMDNGAELPKDEVKSVIDPDDVEKKEEIMESIESTAPKTCNEAIKEKFKHQASLEDTESTLDESEMDTESTGNKSMNKSMQDETKSFSTAVNSTKNLHVRKGIPVDWTLDESEMDTESTGNKSMNKSMQDETKSFSTAVNSTKNLHVRKGITVDWTLDESEMDTESTGNKSMNKSMQDETKSFSTAVNSTKTRHVRKGFPVDWTLYELEMEAESTGNKSINKSMQDETKSFSTAVHSTKTLHVRKGFPLDWTFYQMRTLVHDNVNLNTKYFFIAPLKNELLEPSGEYLMEFNTTEDSEAVYKFFKRKGFDVRYDTSGVNVRAMRNLNKKKMAATSKSTGKTVYSNNKYEFNKRHGEAYFGRQHGANEMHDGEPAEKKMKLERFVGSHVPRAFFPPEPENYDTYGLSFGLLNSLNIKTPLNNKILLSNFADRVNEDKIREVFSLAGQVVSVYFKFKGKTGARKAIVEFDHPVEAVQAISMFRGKPLYDIPMVLHMDPAHFPRRMPEGLTAVGFGLGQDGKPLRGVRAAVDMQQLKKILLDSGTIENVATNKEHRPFLNYVEAGVVNNKSNDPKPAPATNENTLLSTLSALSQQPNLLVGLSALANAQGLLHQGTGDKTSVQNVSPNPPLGYSLAPYDHNPAPYGHNPVPYDHKPPPLGHKPPPLGHKPPPLGHNPAPYGNNPAPYGNNPATYGLNPAAYGHNAAAYGHNPSPSGHSIDNAPQQGFQPTFVQSTVDWQGPQTVQTPPVQYESQPVVYNNTQQTSDDSNKRSIDEFVEDNMNSLDICRNAETRDDDSDKKSGMLVFSNLPSSVTVEALNAKMSEVGKIKFGEITGRGGAVVRFKHAQDAERCIKLFNRSKVDGRTIKVKYF